jgi:hypothetical protein
MPKRIPLPYVASPERRSRILDHWREVMESMPEGQVVAILGEPDERLPLYEPIKKSPRQIGWTTWYILQRLSDVGSAANRGESCVRVTFDMACRVMKVEAWFVSNDGGA